MMIYKKVGWTLLFAVVVSLRGQAQEQTVTLGSLYTETKIELDPMKLRELVNDMDRLAPKVSEPNEDIYLDLGKSYLVLALAKEGNLSEINRWFDKMLNEAARQTAQHEVAKKMLEAGRNQDAEVLISKLLENVKTSVESPSKPGIVTFFRYPSKYDVHRLQGALLFNRGDYQSALPYLEPVPDEEGRVFPNELYVRALIKAGPQDKALQEIEGLLNRPGDHTEQFYTEIKDFYKRLYGSEEKYDQLLAQSQKSHDKRIRESIQKLLINEKAPDFSIKDVHGKEVSLINLKGKTVILDFWATWCGPCVASFPGMQKAVDYYENDPSVVFMFIHTAESGNGDATMEAQKLINDRGYTFDIYMDLKNKEKNENPLLKAFKVEGLPTKFVINKEGNIRFKHTGFVGEKEAVEEIKLMIEMANNS